MAIKLGDALHVVADMDRAVAFDRDNIRLELRFSAPGWAEFATGATTLAPHPASAENPRARTPLGLPGADITALRGRLSAAVARFTRNPTPEQGITLAVFAASEGARVGLSG